MKSVENCILLCYLEGALQSVRMDSLKLVIVLHMPNQSAVTEKANIGIELMEHGVGHLCCCNCLVTIFMIWIDWQWKLILPHWCRNAMNDYCFMWFHWPIVAGCYMETDTCREAPDAEPLNWLGWSLFPFVSTYLMYGDSDIILR